MKNRSLVHDYVSRGQIRLAALQVLYEHGGYADVVREAQEIVELVSKALVRFLGADPARVHDVSSQLIELRDRVPAQQRTQLEKLADISRELRRDRELAFCGSEDLTPSEFYGKKDADEARAFAEFAVRFVKSLVDE